MLRKLLRVNPEAVNVASAIVFIVLCGASFLSVLGFLGYFVLPYLVKHIEIIWR
jgi:hypothetical protein